MATTRILELLLMAFMLFLLESCSIHWTEKQKQEFAQKCSQSDTADHFVFMVTGFNYTEVGNIAVHRIHDGQVIDSFYVHADRNSFDSIRTRYSVTVDKPIYIKDSYYFIMPGQKPFVLSDMKMIMQAQFPKFSNGYGCVMGDYKIDGARFQKNANPDFVKRGFKFDL
jgi:hypothetical protein